MPIVLPGLTRLPRRHVLPMRSVIALRPTSVLLAPARLARRRLGWLIRGRLNSSLLPARTAHCARAAQTTSLVFVVRTFIRSAALCYGRLRLNQIGIRSGWRRISR